MRWDRLFDDLEAQLEHGLDGDADEADEQQERWRLGRLTLRERILALACTATAPLNVRLTDDTSVTVLPASIGADWFSGEPAELGHDGQAPRQGTLVIPLAAVAAIALNDDAAAASIRPFTPPPAVSAQRVGLPIVLRDLCRRRAGVWLRLPDRMLYGTIDRVGADHLDLAVHEPGSPRRRGSVSGLTLVPLARVLLVSC